MSAFGLYGSHNTTLVTTGLMSESPALQVSFPYTHYFPSNDNYILILIHISFNYAHLALHYVYIIYIKWR